MSEVWPVRDASPLLRIAAIDDSPADLLLLQEVLNAYPQVMLSTFASASEAMNAFETHSAGRPHLILLDLQMPGGDGVAWLRELKEHPELGVVPVIIRSGNQQAEVMQAAYGAWASGFLDKPVNLGVLEAQVSALVGFWSLCRFTW